MTVTLKASQRHDHTKSETKQIREKGHVPSVLYGKDKEAKSISVDSIELIKTVRDEGRNAIISLDVDNGETVDVMLHEYQIDPIRDQLIHADFYIVDMKSEMDVEVSIRLEGEPEGAKEGGVLQQPMYVLQVRAKPRDIPEEIVVDVSELGIGDVVSVADLPTSDKYEILDEEDTTIATILPPTTEEELETTAGDETAEPELVDADEDKEEE
ncbi:50S ribosomal protein L25 [Lentibacillus sp. JNUCC-1]|uniref:50S ribosomal protein L25/general stress protein Ctc n=1 Tax=Lentibacillus sp. JNUCC-1 TaxID=2654513 RepID=UPI0012E93F17|nr:50S ribosomal protein L25/general stress protein Ctc [Lentibacillus sp. JNUCC-1]MUV38023.1 50S ribosomal protein L25 [Lentibacillus sp. JNUCC-1]